MSENFHVDLIAIASEPFTDDAEAFVLSLGARSVRPLTGSFTLDSRFIQAGALPVGEERLAILRSLPLPKHMRFATAAMVEAFEQAIGPDNPDIIHLFRSDFLPCIRPLADRLAAKTGKRPFIVADLDDDETESLARLGDVIALYSSVEAGQESRLMAQLTERVFQIELPQFDVVCICSDRDRTRLKQAYPGARIEVLSNTAPELVSEPQTPRLTRPDTIHVLFVGLLCYGPNIDAVELLTQVILPELRKRTSRIVVLDVVGRDAGQEMIRRWSALGAVVHDGADDLKPFYDRADVALVPIRSAGGTRIKILEAFARGTPVVSSSIGAEGLDVENGEHLMIADTTGDMVDVCLAVASDPALRARLTRQARDLVQSRYGPDRVRHDLERIYAQVKSNA